MTMQPLNKRVLIKPKQSETKTAGGIYVPQTGQENKQEGIVVAVAEMDTCPVKVGDRVLFENFGGAEITINGEKHLLLKVEEILAKL